MQPTIDYSKQRERLFPKLTSDQIKRICPFGSRRTMKAGEVAY